AVSCVGSTCSSFMSCSVMRPYSDPAHSSGRVTDQKHRNCDSPAIPGVNFQSALKGQFSVGVDTGIFMMQNPGQYDDFSCLKNSSGRWTLIVYYAAGGGGGAGSWSQHQ
ncbi:hypothetical protein, partial [Branchiibius sp. NY16-3462-2]|uniref:hypothetical protein n=1 Tax=Branchiibius sp. NY16-3462-2 TaxID=1807500 RepID=UPI0025B8A8CD